MSSIYLALESHTEWRSGIVAMSTETCWHACSCIDFLTLQSWSSRLSGLWVAGYSFCENVHADRHCVPRDVRLAVCLCSTQADGAPADCVETSGAHFCCLRRRLRNFEKRAIDRACPSVFGDHFWLLKSLQKRSFNSQEFARSSQRMVVTASSRALWRVLSHKVFWVFGHCWVDTPHINTFKGDPVLSKFVVCSPPSRSRRVINRTIRKSFSSTVLVKFCIEATGMILCIHTWGACAPGSLRF